MQNVILQHIENKSFILPATEEKIKFCPSLSARNRETTKVDSRFSFYSRGKFGLTCKVRKFAYQQVEKENQNKHRQVFADFLQRIPNQGWASAAKPIPTPTKKRKQIRTNTTRCLPISCKGFPTKDGQAKRSQSLLQQKKKTNQNKHRQVFADFLQRIPNQGWASEAKPIPTPTKEENKSEQTQQNYSYHLSHFTSKNIQLWKKKNSKTSNSCFATAKALSIKSHSEKTTS